MEWSRAKNILILTFLALNIFLGYSLWEEFYVYFPSRVVSQREIEQARDSLDSINLDLKASLPRQTFSMSFLTVSSRGQDQEALMAGLLDPELPVHLETEEENGVMVYQQSSKTLSFWDNGRITFIQNFPRDTEEPEPSGEREDSEETMLDEGSAVSLVEEVLEDVRLLPPDARLEEVYPLEEDKYLVTYHQVYKNHSLYGGSLNAWVNPRGIQQLEIYWLAPEGFSGLEITTISAAAALTRLADTLSPLSERQAVESVNLGYYSQVFDAQRWDMVPVWRIRLSNSMVYYINAYTGEQEGMEDFVTNVTFES